MDVMLAEREGFADIDGGAVVFDKFPDARRNMLGGLHSDYGSCLKGSVEPQMKGIISHTG